jgi:tRNA nucleotidyltransferase/poly(A) polymerase
MEPWNDPSVRTILLQIREHCPSSYLVGGAIRDFLMGNPLGRDLDVAVDTDGFELAVKVADRMGSLLSFVPLDPGRGTARLVVRGECQTEIDVSTLKAATIEEDLVLRDFTVNALALSVNDLVDGKIHRVIDVTGGTADLRRRKVRACSRASFADDPLRILRAFRFMAGLGFEIADETLDMIPSNLAGLSSVAAERIRDEFLAVLAAESAFSALTRMDDAGVMAALFPELMLMKGCSQNDFHHLDVWLHSLEAVNQMEALLANNAAAFDDLAINIDRYVREEPVLGRPRTALLKLGAIFHDSGKPQARFIDSKGRVRFFGHERMSRTIFEESALRLKLANREIALVANIIDGHMRPTMFTASHVSTKAINRLHRHFDEDTAGLLILFLSDLGASRGPARRAGEWEKARGRVVHALRLIYETRSQPRERLVTGRDIMTAFQLEPGPHVGKLLSKIWELQDLGEISTKEEALKAVEDMLAEKSRS